MNQAIREFVYCQTIAIVGASRTGWKFGNIAYRELRKGGYDVLAVHPAAETIEGDACYPSLSHLPRMPDGVLISLPPAKTETVLREAAALGIRRVWLQPGSETPALIQLAQLLGLSVAHGACILLYMQPVRSLHTWHRTFAQLFGRLEPTDYITPKMLATHAAPKPSGPGAGALLDDDLVHKMQVK